MNMFELLDAGAVLEVTAQGEWRVHNNPPVFKPTLLLPGSFNPIHKGHWGLAEAAAKIKRKPVAFELSLVNVDKGELEPDIVKSRLVPFRGKASVWLTRAATFREKAFLFAGTMFVVGADTAQRLVDPKYYGGSRDSMLRALSEVGEHRCKFLVAGRLDQAGAFQELEHLPIPAEHRELFQHIPAPLFRKDISSTELRRHD